MKRRFFSLRWQLQLINIFLITIPILVLGSVMYYASQKAIYAFIRKELTNQALLVKKHIETGVKISQKKLSSDLRIAHEKFYAAGTPRLDHQTLITMNVMNQKTQKERAVMLPVMKIGDTSLMNSAEIVDEIQQLVGGTVTIFQIFPQGALRVSTNVLQADGSRAVGTYIPMDSPVYQTIMQGETYIGRAYVVNEWYQTAYEPILDEYANIIGMLYVGMKDAAEPILDSLAEITLGKTGYIWILDYEGKYVLSQKRANDGESILNAKDEDGRYFVQEWIKQLDILKQGDALIDEYVWKNAENPMDRRKMAALTYLPEMGWLIGGSIYLDEYTGSLRHIAVISISVSAIAILCGSVIVTIFSSAIGNHFGRIANALRQIAAGQITGSLQLSHNNEFVIMAQALQDVQETLQHVIKEINSLCAAIREGTFTARGDADALRGAWKTLIVGINELIEAFVQPISATTAALEHAAQGHLDEAMTETFHGDFNHIKTTVNMMLTQFNTVVTQAKATADKLTMNSQQLSTRAKIITEGASKQAATAAELSASMEEFSSTIKQTAQNAQQTKLIAIQAVEDTRKSGATVIETVKAMRNIAEKISLIEEIAAQTHMLSLNAAIEAGKAEQHGKGFNVVAVEVRSLAERSRSVAEEIRELATSSVAVATQSGKMLEQLVPSIENTTLLIEEISSANSEQSFGVEQINNAIRDLDLVIQQNAMTSEDLSSTAETLATQSRGLQEAIAFFKT